MLLQYMLTSRQFVPCLCVSVVACCMRALAGRGVCGELESVVVHSSLDERGLACVKGRHNVPCVSTYLGECRVSFGGVGKFVMTSGLHGNKVLLFMDTFSLLWAYYCLRLRLLSPGSMDYVLRKYRRLGSGGGV